MATSTISRTWKQVSGALQKKVIWDMGDEQWELMSNDEIRHVQILSRQILTDSPLVVQEILQLLPETPVPLEALVRHSVEEGWFVEEQLIVGEVQVPPLAQPLAQPLMEKQIVSESSNKTKGDRKKGVISHPPPSPPLPSEDPVFHGQRSQSSPNSPAADPVPPSYNLPMELWSSLSQWIPSNALYQPSLHLLITSELSESQFVPSVHQKHLGDNSRPGPNRHRHEGRGSQTKPRDRPHNVSHGFQGHQAKKEKSFQQYSQHYSKPLFV